METEYITLSSGNDDIVLDEMEDQTSQQLLIHEMRTMKIEFKKLEETNRKIIGVLTEKIIALKHEVKQNRLSQPGSSDTSLLPTLPICSLNLLKEFDDQLLLDEDVKSQLKNLIQRVGGSDMPSFMRAAIKSVISDKLAVNLTWRGTPTKPSIQNFVSFKIIKDICNLKYTHCTITDINRVCQQHVLHARDRLISRKNKN
ncbi:uncharacterized protein LOC142227276 isoform X1 [Haematobia irritans]|uniref:uncharacterized protein LOC142227276 isoform X1 n=2 Tax=Haematobia irritans TaxID=7368 RepID=UPI003F50C20A